MNDKFIIITIWRNKGWKRMIREVTGMQRLTRRVNYEKASEREYGIQECIEGKVEEKMPLR